MGYIRRGCFNLLFSAGIPLGGRELGVDVPRTFKELDVGLVLNAQPLLPGHLSTNTVREIPARGRGPIYPCVRSPASFSESQWCRRSLEPGSSVSFQLAGDQGAVLLTKHPIYREDVQLGRAFEEYTKEHHNSWVVFARERGHPNDIKPVLVTGVDMTRDFAMVAYSNYGDDLTVEFTISAPGVVSPWGTWRTPGVVYKNCGPQLCRPPSSTQAADLASSSNSHAQAVSDEYHQCVFVRYYAMRRRLGIPRIIKAAAGPHDLGPGSRDGEGSPPEAHCNSDLGSDTISSLFDDDGDGEGSPATSSDSESETEAVIHNTVAVCSSSFLPIHTCSKQPFVGRRERFRCRRRLHFPGKLALGCRKRQCASNLPILEL